MSVGIWQTDNNDYASGTIQGVQELSANAWPIFQDAVIGQPPTASPMVINPDTRIPSPDKQRRLPAGYDLALRLGSFRRGSILVATQPGRIDDLPPNLDPGLAVLTSAGLQGGQPNVPTWQSLAQQLAPYALTTAVNTLLSSYTTTAGTQAAVQNQTWVYATDTGTSTALVVALSPAPAAMVNGLTVCVLPANTCGANPTLNLNSLGAYPILKQSGQSVAAGDMVQGIPARLVFTNFFWWLLDPVCTTVSALAPKKINLNPFLGPTNNAWSTIALSSNLSHSTYLEVSNGAASGSWLQWSNIVIQGGTYKFALGYMQWTSGGIAAVQYSLAGAGSWTTIGTIDTNGATNYNQHGSVTWSNPIPGRYDIRIIVNTTSSGAYYCRPSFAYLQRTDTTTPIYVPNDNWYPWVQDFGSSLGITSCSTSSVALTFSTNASFTAFCGWCKAGSAQGNWIQLGSIILAAGTYTFQMMRIQNTDQGQTQFRTSPAGAGTWTNQGGTLEGYAASATYNVVQSVTGISIASTALYDIQLYTNAKNASSSAYALNLQSFQVTRTA